MASKNYFAPDYQTARRNFVEACDGTGIMVESHPHPLPGPSGEALSMDAAWIGPRDAERVLVTCSATHGVEGFCGSAGQVGWLRSGHDKTLPAGVAMLIVHALNPFGFAWLRRVNEDNVDLNRTFLDHDAGHPENPGYDLLAGAICPPKVEGPIWAQATQDLEQYEQIHGTEAWLDAVVKGQYRHPDGLFFGGTRQTWSDKTYSEILARHLAGARHVAYIDFHSGLGPYGYGMPMSCNAYGSAGYQHSKDWYGAELTSTGDGSQFFPDNTGDSSCALERAAQDSSLAAICLEFGTRPEWQVLNTLRKDNWLHVYGDIESPQGRAIKAELKDAFYPEEEAWMDQVWARCLDVQQKALAGLAGV